MRLFLVTLCLVITGSLFLLAQQKQLSKLYRLDGDEIQYSIDAGANWEELKLPFDKSPTAFYWDAKAPDRLLLGMEGGICLSTDAGKTWHSASIPSFRVTPKRFYVSRKNPAQVYCAGSVETTTGNATEMWQSMDGGAAWTRRWVSREPVESLKFDPDNIPTSPVIEKKTQQTATGNKSAATQTTACNIVWSEPIMLSNSAAPYSISPKIALTGDDTVQVTWEFDTPVKLPYRRSTDGGNTFEPVREMLTDTIQYPYYAYHPFIVSDRNTVFLFFVAGQSTGGHEPLRMMRSTDAGTTWEDIREITTDTTGADVWAAISGNTLMISYFSYREYKIKYIVSSDAGITWNTLPLRDQYDYTRFAITPGNIHMADNAHGLAPAMEVIYFRSTDLGQAWTDSLMLSENDGWFSDVWTIDAKERHGVTEVWSAWRDVKYGHYGDTGADILFRSRIDSAAWYPEQVLTDEPNGTEPRLSTNGKNRAITWWVESVAGESTEIAARATQNSLNNFCPVVNLTPHTQTGWPMVKVSSHAVHIVWEECDGNNFHIYYMKGEFPVIHANLAVAETSLVFDTTEVLSTRTDTLHIANTGTDTLTIGTIMSNSSNFTVAPDEMIIPPGENGTIAITFAPVTSGMKQGKIILYSDASTSPDVVPVSEMGRWHTVEVSYPAGGWQLLSSPVQPPREFTLPSLYQWNSGYRKCDTMEAGKGYWAKPASAVAYYGTPKSADTIEVMKGWNMIGALEEAVPVTSVATDPPSIIDSYFYGYSSSGYSQSDSLMPGYGYWVKVKQDGKAILQGTRKKE
jgi:hypothetical protein